MHVIRMRYKLCFSHAWTVAILIDFILVFLEPVGG
jgi:hypothetical protein